MFHSSVRPPHPLVYTSSITWTRWEFCSCSLLLLGLMLRPPCLLLLPRIIIPSGVGTDY